MIDTHSHILPHIDDGPDTTAGAVRIAKMALSEGTSTLFATPHCCNGVYSTHKDDIIRSCSDLTEKLAQEGVFIQILPGAEIRVNHDLVAEFDKGSLMTLNNAGAYILLELPSMFQIKSMGLMIRKLCQRGVVPIIAHPERNLMILNWPRILDDLIYNGAVMQITAASLMGDFGKPAMTAARDMVVMGQVFSLGSDMHPGRKYRMFKAREKLIKLAGPKKADLILRKNPSAIVETCFVHAYEIPQKSALQPSF